MVWPSICLLISHRESISAGRASPRTKRAITLFIQSTPAATGGRNEERPQHAEAATIYSGTRAHPTFDLCPPQARGEPQRKPHPAWVLTLSAWGALATALVLVELNEASDGFHNVRLEGQRAVNSYPRPEPLPSEAAPSDSNSDLATPQPSRVSCTAHSP